MTIGVQICVDSVAVRMLRNVSPTTMQISFSTGLTSVCNVVLHKTVCNITLYKKKKSAQGWSLLEVLDASEDHVALPWRQSGMPASPDNL